MLIFLVLQINSHRFSVHFTNDFVCTLNITWLDTVSLNKIILYLFFTMKHKGREAKVFEPISEIHSKSFFELANLGRIDSSKSQSSYCGYAPTNGLIRELKYILNTVSVFLPIQD
ncbi:hypothetical protein ABIB40_003120 [Pedobacter sp. UYP30]